MAIEVTVAGRFAEALAEDPLALVRLLGFAPVDPAVDAIGRPGRVGRLSGHSQQSWAYAERTGFPFEMKHWCRCQTRGVVSVRDPAAPSALADPGLVLVRGSDHSGFQDERKGWIMSVKLNDAQLVMMSAAAQREDRCLATPDRLKGAAVGKVCAKLVKLGLAREISAKPGTPICAATKRGWRSRSN